jgi:RNA polymerase sigma factor (sigma-70 family)
MAVEKNGHVILMPLPISETWPLREPKYFKQKGCPVLAPACIYRGMQEMDDMALLREFATNNSEAAFETLVSRHVNFVYSAALRQVRDPHLAKEVTQAAFIILAQKAGGLSDKTILTGWLYRTARFAALAQARAAAKRRQREQEANMQSEIQPSAPDVCWEQMSPLLDEALATLGEKDRQAVLLRFFENKSLAEVGSSLGMGEDTARKRVARALGKLHRYFSSHGVVSTAAMIAGSISANSVQAAPVALTKFITAAGIVKGAASGASTLTLIKGALRIMAWTKAKTAIVVGVGILLTVGTAMVAVKQIQMHGIYRGSWQVKEITLDESILDRMPPMVQILPTKFARFNTVKDGIGIRRARGNKMAGLRQPVSEIILTAYGGGSPVRVVAGTGLPPNMILSLPCPTPRWRHCNGKSRINSGWSRDTKRGKQTSGCLGSEIPTLQDCGQFLESPPPTRRLRAVSRLSTRPCCP